MENFSFDDLGLPDEVLPKNPKALFSSAKDAVFSPSHGVYSYFKHDAFLRTINKSFTPTPGLHPSVNFINLLTDPRAPIARIKGHLLDEKQNFCMSGSLAKENSLLPHLIAWCPEHDRFYFDEENRLSPSHIKLYEPLGKFLTHLSHTGIKIEVAHHSLLDDPKLFNQSSTYTQSCHDFSYTNFAATPDAMVPRNREHMAYYRHFGVSSAVNFPFIKNFENQLKDKGWRHEMLLILCHSRHNVYGIPHLYDFSNCSLFILHRFIDPDQSIAYVYTAPLRISTLYEGLSLPSSSRPKPMRASDENELYNDLAFEMAYAYKRFSSLKTVAKLSPSLVGVANNLSKQVFEIQPLGNDHSFLFLPAPGNPNGPLCTPLAFSTFLYAGTYNPKAYFNFSRKTAKAIWHFWYNGLTSIKAWDDKAPFTSTPGPVYLPSIPPEEQRIKGFIDNVVLHH